MRVVKEALSIPVANPPSEILLKKNSEKKRSDRRNLEAVAAARDTFSREVMVLRNGKGLEECLRKVEEASQALSCEHDSSMSSLITGKHMLTAMRLITAAAFKRHESLGPHLRTD